MTDTPGVPALSLPANAAPSLAQHTVPAERPSAELQIHPVQHGGLLILARDAVTSELKALASFTTHNELTEWLAQYFAQPIVKPAASSATPLPAITKGPVASLSGSVATGAAAVN